MNKPNGYIAYMLGTLEAPCQFAARADAEAEKQAAQQAAQQAEDVREWRERLTPIDVRLARTLDSIPAEVRQQGISLPSLVPLLKGRYRERPRAGDIGDALRRMGWTRTRKWRCEAEGFRALWYPPTN